MGRPLYLHGFNVEQHALHLTQRLQVIVYVFSSSAYLASHSLDCCFCSDSSFMGSEVAIFFNFKNFQKLF
jgi:hypothetical protein